MFGVQSFQSLEAFYARRVMRVLWTYSCVRVRRLLSRREFALYCIWFPRRKPAERVVAAVLTGVWGSHLEASSRTASLGAYSHYEIDSQFLRRSGRRRGKRGRGGEIRVAASLFAGYASWSSKNGPGCLKTKQFRALEVLYFCVHDDSTSVDLWC